MSSERQNYNLATGQCTAASCEHFMQVRSRYSSIEHVVFCLFFLSIGSAATQCLLWLRGRILRSVDAKFNASEPVRVSIPG